MDNMGVHMEKVSPFYRFHFDIHVQQFVFCNMVLVWMYNDDRETYIKPANQREQYCHHGYNSNARRHVRVYIM